MKNEPNEHFNKSPKQLNETWQDCCFNLDMKMALLLIVPILLFSNRSIAQNYQLLLDGIVHYFSTYDDLSIQAEIRPGFQNTFFSFGVRGGHNNKTDNITIGLSIFYSKDKFHGEIGPGTFKNYHFGLYGEKKFRKNRNQKLYLSTPLTLAVGVSTTDQYDPSYADNSIYFYSEAELLINYGLGNRIQLNFGPGIRICDGSDTFGLNDRDLSGLSFQAGIRFGNFTQ